jgi:hypothetical protein
MRTSRSLATGRGPFSVATDANSFFVPDFALFLEYIESPFYDVNVPQFS